MGQGKVGGGSPDLPDSEPSQQQPLLSSFNSAEFPEVKVTPEGETDKPRNSRE